MKKPMTTSLPLNAAIRWGMLALAMCLLHSPALAADSIDTANGPLAIHPVQHASFGLKWDGKLLLVDPVGGADKYKDLGAPDLILLTDIHGDHVHVPTLEGLVQADARLMAPEAVVAMLPDALKAKAITLANGQSTNLLGISFEALPAYNLTPGRLQYHTKGRGNGYLLTLGGKRVYISGDTEDIPEMKALKEIDLAFLCMNLPYTMTVEQAASAIKAFQPKVLYPYHYRGSDLDKLKSLLTGTSNVELRLRDWYPK